MRKTSDKNHIPKKFRAFSQSFIDRITDDTNVNVTTRGAFHAFPKDLSFYGQEEGEDIVLVLRAHIIYFIPFILASMLAFIVPLVLLANLGGSEYGSVSMYMGFFVFGVLLSISIFITGLVKWFYNVFIITDQRIIDVQLESVFTHSYKEAQLEKIEDITHKHIGLISTIFDAGNIYIQTASKSRDFDFMLVPRPRDVQDVLNDLLELKQQGKI